MQRSYRKKRRRKGSAEKIHRPGLVLTVRARPGNPHQGLINVGGAVLPCALGKGGITAAKREGDGRTPLAAMRVLSGYFRADGFAAARRTRLAMAPIGPALGWCEVPADRNYNRPVRMPYGASHERMRRDDHLYDVCLVLDWNVRPRRRNRGSAIFLHLARPGLAPTEGCVAVSRATMRRLLPWLSKESVVKVVR